MHVIRVDSELSSRGRDLVLFSPGHQAAIRPSHVFLFVFNENDVAPFHWSLNIDVHKYRRIYACPFCRSSHGGPAAAVSCHFSSSPSILFTV
jgi:hypothetical protein